jgi:hypothetical protein
MKNIFQEIKYRLDLEISDENILETIDGNLIKLKYYFQNEFIKRRETLHSSQSLYPGSKKFFNTQTQKISQEISREPEKSNDETERDFSNVSYFHLIGKIIYNKRLDPVTGELRGMLKSELNSKPAPKLYFNLNDVISTMHCSNLQFNETLAENSFDHFRDIKEIARACEDFSFADALSKSSSFKQPFMYEENSLKNIQSRIFASACMFHNKSQYSSEKFEKPRT